MSQEITIIILVDIQAALEANSLDGNIYLIDNLRTDGSEGEGTGNLITAIDGSYWCDGTQCCDIVLNWLITGIGNLPNTLPRYYNKTRSKNIDQYRLKEIQNFHLNKNETNSKTALLENRIIQNIGNSDQLQIAPSKSIDLGIKSLNVFGDAFDKSQDISSLSFLPPQVSNITGEAVDKGVLLPAQYGTPIPIKDGWYWSATVDTSKTGIHDYTLHLTLYNMVEGIWVPVEMTHQAQIRVTNQPQRNGFTNAGIGLLTLI